MSVDFCQSLAQFVELCKTIAINVYAIDGIVFGILYTGQPRY